jgi:hypothetical protein
MFMSWSFYFYNSCFPFVPFASCYLSYIHHSLTNTLQNFYFLRLDNTLQVSISDHNKMTELSFCLSTTSWRRMGSGGIAPWVVSFGILCRWMVIFTPWPLYPQGRVIKYPLVWRVVGRRNWPGIYERKNVSCPSQSSNPVSPFIQSTNVYNFVYI